LRYQSIKYVLKKTIYSETLYSVYFSVLHKIYKALKKEKPGNIVKLCQTFQKFDGIEYHAISSVLSSKEVQRKLYFQKDLF